MLSNATIKKIKVLKVMDKEDIEISRKYIDKSRRINNKSIRKLQEKLYRNILIGE